MATHTADQQRGRYERVIVSRHPAAIEFIRQFSEWHDAPAIESATADDVRDAVVAGNLPMHLAALAREVWAVEFTGAPPRGAEYSLEAMIAAGAVLRCYQVRRLSERSGETQRSA